MGKALPLARGEGLFPLSAVVDFGVAKMRPKRWEKGKNQRGGGVCVPKTRFLGPLWVGLGMLRPEPLPPGCKKSLD